MRRTDRVDLVSDNTLHAARRSTAFAQDHGAHMDAALERRTKGEGHRRSRVLDLELYPVRRDPQREIDFCASELDVADANGVPLRWYTRGEVKLAFGRVDLDSQHPA